VPDIANVTLTGEISATVDGERLPIGDLVLDNVPPEADLSELDASDSTTLDVPFTAVEVEGKWYLSVFFTVAELARQSADPVPDIPTAGIEPAGGDTPEDALDEVLEAVEALDLRAMIAAINPGDAAALQRYAPLFVDDAQAELDAVPFELDITEAEYTVTGDGARRHATIDVLALEGDVDGMRFEAELADGCMRAVVAGEEFDSCNPDPGMQAELDELIAEGPVGDLVATLRNAFADYQQPGITLVRTDGEWYVSPIGTASDQLLALLRALDREEIEELAATIPPAIEYVLAGMFGAPPFGDDVLDGGAGDVLPDDLFGEDGLPDDLFGDDLFGELPLPGEQPPGDDATADTVPLDSVPLDSVPGDDAGSDPGTRPPDSQPTAGVPPETFPESPLTRCWDMAEAAAASSCFQEVVGAGEAEYWEVPVEMLHPECGVAEAYWSNYQLSDDAFFELIDAARPCFLALVESGEYLESDLPVEYTKPECYEGRNWYQVLDDPDYDQRVLDCKYG
jgi:hypothetical protein